MCNLISVFCRKLSFNLPLAARCRKIRYMERRRFLYLAGGATQYLLATGWLAGCSGDEPAGKTGFDARPVVGDTPERVLSPNGSPSRSNLSNIGPLQAPDANGICLPVGFSARVVARSGEDPTGGSGYLWHWAPDGGAVFGASDGGWVYVSNSEMDEGTGGVGALRFDVDGNLLDAYAVLTGTTRNCAGGATPWQTWLSCEEADGGRVWECDPFGRGPAVVRPALGVFTHEAAVVDRETGQLYLTEDQPDGGWYRFTPRRVDVNGRADLSSGTLEVARVEGASVTWLKVPDPLGVAVPTRYQARHSTPFNGGEGMTYADGYIYFTTKGDDRVWGYHIETATLAEIYHAATAANPILTGVDNLETNGLGDLLVAEDGGDMEIVVITPDGSLRPLLQVTGHYASEITGPAFTPDQTRLYFSSQRGPSGWSADGITYEVSGPFVI